MDILFKDLLKTIEEFIQLSAKASTKRSDYGIKHNEPSEMDLEAWNEMLDKAKDRYGKLKVLLTDGFEKNKNEVDRYLSFYRQLSRYLAEIPCYWSAYYNDIRKNMGERHDYLIDIDCKYKMGWHQND